MAYDRDVGRGPRRAKTGIWAWIVIGIIIVGIALLIVIPAFDDEEDEDVFDGPVDVEDEVDEGAFIGDQLSAFAVDGVRVVVASWPTGRGSEAFVPALERGARQAGIVPAIPMPGRASKLGRPPGDADGGIG